jgi:hypothetical protein
VVTQRAQDQFTETPREFIENAANLSLLLQRGSHITQQFSSKINHL